MHNIHPTHRLVSPSLVVALGATLLIVVGTTGLTGCGGGGSGSTSTPTPTATATPTPTPTPTATPTPGGDNVTVN